MRKHRLIVSSLAVLATTAFLIPPALSGVAAGSPVDHRVPAAVSPTHRPTSNSPLVTSLLEAQSAETQAGTRLPASDLTRMLAASGVGLPPVVISLPPAHPTPPPRPKPPVTVTPPVTRPKVTTQPTPAVVAPAVSTAPSGSGVSASLATDFAELRQCESGGDYSINTGNGYYGAYQFSATTWHGLGFPGLPSDASPATQDQAAAELLARSGWGQWPACSARLGL